MNGYLVILQSYADDIVVKGYTGRSAQRKALEHAARLKPHVPKAIQQACGRRIKDEHVTSVAVAYLRDGEMVSYRIVREFNE
jgi:hypothetical protein